jgi:hypothetical protein
MPTTPYDLFDPTRWSAMIRRLKSDPKTYISGEELAKVLRANRGNPIPDAALDYLCRFLEGSVKQRAGRKRLDTLALLRESLAIAQYERYLRWLQKRKAARGLAGWSCIQGAEWWKDSKDSPAQRAAKMVQARMFRTHDWRHIQNIVSKHRS